MSRITFKKHVYLLLLEKKKKSVMFLSKTLIHSHMIHDTVKENIFAVIVYKLLTQKKY